MRYLAPRNPKWTIAALAALSLALVALAGVPAAGADADDVVITSTQCDTPTNPENDNLDEEWIEITNFGATPVDMSGWILHDEDTGAADEWGNHAFSFSEDVSQGAFVLHPGAAVKVHTGEGADTQTDLYWDRGSAVWNNDGDVAFLRDDARSLVSSLDCGDTAGAPEQDEEEAPDEVADEAPEQAHDAEDADAREEDDAIVNVRGGAPSCPDGLTAVALQEGIHLSWDHHLAAEDRQHPGFETPAEFHVYRAPADAAHADAFERIATVNAQTTQELLDETAEPGQAYAYKVTYDDGVESAGCALAEATAIPFFGAPIIGALALVGAIGAYAWMRRR